MDSGSSRLFLLPRAGGGFELRETRTGAVLAKPYTKLQGFRQATLLLERHGGGRIVVVGGRHDDVLVVDAAGPRPRWYIPSSPLRWLPVPLLGLQLVLRLLLPMRPDPLQLALSGVLVGLLLLTVVTVSASVLLDRRRRPRPAGPQEAVQD